MPRPRLPLHSHKARPLRRIQITPPCRRWQHRRRRAEAICLAQCRMPPRVAFRSTRPDPSPRDRDRARTCFPCSPLAPRTPW
jgi:hypothetical protein